MNKDLDKLKLEGQINKLHSQFDCLLMLCDVNHLHFINVQFKREDIILLREALEIAREVLK